MFEFNARTFPDIFQLLFVHVLSLTPPFQIDHRDFSYCCFQEAIFYWIERVLVILEFLVYLIAASKQNFPLGSNYRPVMAKLKYIS